MTFVLGHVHLMMPDLESAASLPEHGLTMRQMAVQHSPFRILCYHMTSKHKGLWS